ncbi:hypothetical protein H310_12430 [Aphanomyces invadans]|uniref:Fe2OG dioxygenase domain-containing protein n=1 Tax=Aphanomyces invadans TaxID=157072 RepID=A0A024THX2_9STRA|nr:hypothetical protein H310_12430 [Aphanomyces invadans]ETV93663.1 hypothetical protein H310_12430 [Aphanomyces invadans]|eukprot:XP_008877704.1 hypothetical protein H310_12430 [Aphanomyces invadans]
MSMSSPTCFHRRAIVVLLCMAMACLGVSNDTKIVTVFNNGESVGGIQVPLTFRDVPTGKHLAEYLSTLLDVEGMYTDETKTSSKAVADRVYTSTGKAVHSFDDIVPNDSLYIVPTGLLFVWPFIEFGHRVALQSSQSPTGKPIILESFNDSPRVFLIHDFFTDKEADRLIERISEIDDDANKLKRSTVGHDDKGTQSSVRTSENAFDSTSPEAISLMKRSFDLLNIGDYQESMADGLQLLRYKQKQAYIPHNDWFELNTTPDFNWEPKAGGTNRFATVFLYLSNVTRGGQTVFPLANMPPGVTHATPPTDEEMELFEKGSWEYRMVKQCYSKLASYPRKTASVLFYHQKGTGDMDVRAEHGGCPVLEGTKWAANLWVWNRDRNGPEGSALTVDFVNTRDHPVGLFWSDSHMTDLKPGQKINYNSFGKHTWTFRDADGNDLYTHTLNYKDGPVQVIKIPPTTNIDELSAPAVPDEL